MGSSWHPLVDSEGKPQLPIQEDETALVLFALWRHFQKYREIEFIKRVYHNLVIKAADFLLNHRDEKTGLPKPSFDMWEQRTGVFTSTVATVCAALNAAASFARIFYDSERQETLKQASTYMKEAMLTHLFDRKLGRFLKAIYPNGTHDTTVDSSLSFVFMSGTFDAKEEVVESTMNSIVNRLWVKTDVGGLARFENDEYHRASRDLPGNPWLICTLWLSRWYIAKATSLKELNKGLDILRWTVRNSARSGVLAEQLNPYTGTPVSVSPLVWSHAEFVLATCEYLRKYDEVSSGANMTFEK
jgi:GH15 family glucan-1,4-alpha-glucosidase